VSLSSATTTKWWISHCLIDLVLGFDFVWNDLACYAAGVGPGILIDWVGLHNPMAPEA
jgi:hypothetical protein